MGVKKSAVCNSRPPPNGMNPASSRVSIPLTKPSTEPGASPLSTCSRSPGANLEAQPALVEYFVSLMRVRPSIAVEYTLQTRRLDGVLTSRTLDAPLLCMSSCACFAPYYIFRAIGRAVCANIRRTERDWRRRISDDAADGPAWYERRRFGGLRRLR